MNQKELFLEDKFKIISKLVPKNSSILDIGCNDAKIKDFLQCKNYFGIDIDEELIDKLVKKGINAKRVDLNSEEIPFKNNHFDFILLLDVLEHVIDPRTILKKINKRINKDTKVIASLPNDYHILNKIRFVFNKSLTEDSFAPYGHLHYFPIKEGEKLLTENGFKIIDKKIVSPAKPKFLPKFLRKILAEFFPQSFARDIIYVLS